MGGGWPARPAVAVWFRDEVFRPPLAKGAISSRRAAYCGLPRGGAAAAIGRTRPSLGPRILQSSSRFAESSSLASGRGGPAGLRPVPSCCRANSSFRVPSGPARHALRAIQLFRTWRNSMNRPGARPMAVGLSSFRGRMPGNWAASGESATRRVARATATPGGASYSSELVALSRWRRLARRRSRSGVGQGRIFSVGDSLPSRGGMAKGATIPLAAFFAYFLSHHRK